MRVERVATRLLGALRRRPVELVRVNARALLTTVRVRAALVRKPVTALLAPSPQPAAINPPPPARIRAAVARVPALLAGPATCMVQSLALTHLLSHYGYASELVLGVPACPGSSWQAHAWVRATNDADPPGYVDLLRLPNRS